MSVSNEVIVIKSHSVLKVNASESVRAFHLKCWMVLQVISQFVGKAFHFSVPIAFFIHRATCLAYSSHHSSLFFCFLSLSTFILFPHVSIMSVIYSVFLFSLYIDIKRFFDDNFSCYSIEHIETIHFITPVDLVLSAQGRREKGLINDHRQHQCCVVGSQNCITSLAVSALYDRPIHHLHVVQIVSPFMLWYVYFYCYPACKQEEEFSKSLSRDCLPQITIFTD